MSSSSLNLYLTKMAQGDMTVANSACRKLANRFIAVPATECQEDQSVIVSTLILNDGDKKQVPVFTSEILLKEWCTSQNVENDHVKLLGADFCAALNPNYYLLVDPGSGHQVLLAPELVDEIACTPSDLNPIIEVVGPTVRAEVVEPMQSQPLVSAPPMESTVDAVEEQPVLNESTQAYDLNIMFDAPLGALPVPDSQLEFADQEQFYQIQDAFDEDFMLDDSEFSDVLTTADKVAETEIIETEVEVSPQVSSLSLQDSKGDEKPTKKFSTNFNPSNDPSATQFVKPIHRNIGAESLSDRFMFSKKEKSKEG
jgi:SseB protein N-terminal domain